MVRSDLQQWLLPTNCPTRPVRFSLPSQLTGSSQSCWLAKRETGRDWLGSAGGERDREWLVSAGGERVPPLPGHHAQQEKERSLAESVREGLLRAGAGFGAEKCAGVGPAENDLTTKLRSSLQTFNEKCNSDWIADEDDDEVSIVTLNTDTTNSDDFDDFSDLQSDLDT